MNVRPRETEKFARLAALWWDPRGPMHSLHAVNPLRTGYIADHVDLRDKRVLDVGCGAGLLTESLARLGARASGVDLAQELVDMARQHATQRGLLVDYRHDSAEQLAAHQPASFDVVTCMEVLEHIPRPQAVIQASSVLLKAGGHAFFSTIDRTPKSFLFVILGSEYVLRLLPVGSHSYKHLIRPRELNAWACRSGLHFVRSASISYNLLTRRFKLVPYLGVNYIMHFVKS